MSELFQGRSICPGIAEGQALVAKQGISFWGGVDLETGTITEVGHDLYGEQMAGKILVLPALKGSAGGLWVIIRLAVNKTGPHAIIVSCADTILVGAVIMGGIPTVDSLPQNFLKKIKSGDMVKVDGAEGTVALI